MSKDYYFSGIKKIVKIVILNYNIYNKAKLVYYVFYKLLKLLLVATRVQKLIAIDFIVKLLLFKELITNVIYNFIQVNIDRYTKYSRFILYKEESNTIDFVYIFLKHVVLNYSLLKKIILDKDKLQVSSF